MRLRSPSCFFSSRWCIYGPRVLVKFWESTDVNGRRMEAAGLIGYMVAWGLLTDFTIASWLPAIGAEHCWDAARMIKKTTVSDLPSPGLVLERSFTNYVWKLEFQFAFNQQLYTPGQVFLKHLSVLVALVEVTGLSLHKVREDLHVVDLHLRGNLVTLMSLIQ